MSRDGQSTSLSGASPAHNDGAQTNLLQQHSLKEWNGTFFAIEMFLFSLYQDLKYESTLLILLENRVKFSKHNS